MFKNMRLLVAAALTFVCAVASAQITTSTLSGKVTDSEKEAIIGATVQAIHTPSGTSYGTITNIDGRYTIQGMRAGGPYKVTISYVGYQTAVYEDITLALGETYVLNHEVQESSELLGEVVISATASKFSAVKTGASVNITNDQMAALPNSSRSIQAITKLSPYSNGMSFAGSDDRSTNFTVDGANLNNNFGLKSQLPGGGTPISLDAIEEIQLVVAPFDVRQSNFVGGGINAITKSGTNKTKGTAYVHYQNQGLYGHQIGGEYYDVPKLSNAIYGFTLGGPIIKNKLFYFANFEMQDQLNQVVEYQASEEKQAVLQQIKDKVKNDYGYDAGSYTDFPGSDSNMKILGRIDWNINDNHKFSARYNYTINEHWMAPNNNSCDDSFRNKGYNRASTVSQPFSNNLYSENNVVTTIAGELNSHFSNNLSNRLLATYTNINDQRGSNSSIFPHVDIMTDADYSSGNFIPYTSLGYELFTFNNGVKNKQISVSDNITYNLGSHTITAGASFEYMDALNSYMRNATGYYRFASASDFLTGATPLSFCLTYGYDGNENPAGEVTYNQYGIYAQDDWNVTENFKLNYGLRADLIAYDDSNILTNPNIVALDFGGRSIDTGAWPKARPQISPRVGFNWDVKGDKSFVVRGGTGFFQGRLPLVFFTNMPQYSGMIQGTYAASAYFKDGVLTYDPETLAVLNQLMAGGKMNIDTKDIVNLLGLPKSPSSAEAGMGGNANNGYIVGVDQDFRMPQQWKSSLAIDYRFPTSFPFSVTAEGMFNKTLWGVCMEDWNVNNDKLTATFAGPDNRVNWQECTDYKYTDYNAYVMTNTRKGWGYTANITFNAEPIKNLKLMAAYTHTEAKEISGMPGSAANSVYTGMPTISGTNLTGLQRSQYVLPDKFMASASYFVPFDIFGGRGLNLSLYYSGYSSFGNSFIYSNDMNGDGNKIDLIYIPANKDEINFVSDADAEAFWAFVENDSYLSKHKGQYAEAFASRAPFIHRIDFRVAEDFPIHVGKNTHFLQASLSVDNIGNMFNSKWGVQKLSCYQTDLSTGTIAPLKYEGKNAAGEPTFSMNKVGGEYPVENYTSYYKNSSECWQILLGLKYIFN